LVVASKTDWRAETEPDRSQQARRGDQRTQISEAAAVNWNQDPINHKTRQETRGSSDQAKTKKEQIAPHEAKKQLPLKTELIYPESKRSPPSLPHLILGT
jgi:hypothetical protein